MECRSCGTTIADKAIVCFRCGAPTALPVSPRRPATARPAPPGLWVPVAALVLAAAIVAAGYQLGDWRRALWIALVVEGAITGWWAWRRGTAARRTGVD